MAIVGATSYTASPIGYAQVLIGRTLINTGATDCDGCLIYGDEGAVLHNTATGTFRVMRDSAFAWCTPHTGAEYGQLFHECLKVGAAPLFRNEGTLVTIGPGTLYFKDVPSVPAPRPRPGQLANSGTIRVEAGGLNAAGGYTQTGGALDLRGGSVAGSTLDIQGGTVRGTGTITGTLVNAATVQPGGSGTVGTLTIAGTYRQAATGRLEIEIGGLTAGTQFDRLAVSGQATLNGALAVSRIGGFVPSTGNNFVILTYGVRSGSFASVNGGSTNYTIDYGTQDAKLGVP
jgi:hypothetical protein